MKNKQEGLVEVVVGLEKVNEGSRCKKEMRGE